MRARHRTHQGWVDVVRSRPDIPKRVKRLLLAVADGTYVNKRRNEYAITQTELARRLDVDVSNVKRASWEALDAGWLVLCVRGRNGRQQVLHRSVPWDPPRHWSKTPCPRCGGHLTVRQARVDRETGEVLEVGVRNAPLDRTATRTPYVRTTSAPQNAHGYEAHADAIASAIGGAA